IAGPLADGGHVAESPVCLAVGIRWRESAFDQRAPPQVEVQPYLLGELVVEAIAAQVRHDAAKEREHSLCPRPSLGQAIIYRDSVAGFMTRVIAAIRRSKLDSASPSCFRPATVSR